MSSLIDVIALQEDELILMISRGNEEALGLLFSLYETKLRFESTTFGNKFNLPVIDKEDLYQEIKLSLYEAVLKYDFRQGKFYNFWYTLMRRNIFSYLKKECSPSNDSRRNEQFDEGKGYLDLSFNDSNSIDSDLYFSVFDDEKDRVFSMCLKLWVEGYSYKEISVILDMTIASVNYHIRAGISKMKEKIKGN